MLLTATKSTSSKLFSSYIFAPPHPQGHVITVKYKQPLDKLAVLVWLLYHHQNFKHCILYVGRMEL